MFSAHLFDYSSKPLYYHPDKNHIIVTTTWKRHTFPPNLGHVYIYKEWEGEDVGLEKK